MRNLKKFLALVLSMMMVLSLFVTASATSIDKDGKDQSFTDTDGVEFLEAIEVLNGMDVLKGRASADGSTVLGFFPNEQITRAEVAALVFRLSTGMTGTDAANHYAQYGNFSDVDKNAWYAGYVGYCANAGYIKGYDPGEGGRFGPSDPVTGYQALAMILRAMGWGVNGEFEGTNWQLNVASVGTQTGILDNINSTHFGGATLQQAAVRQVVAEIYLQAAMTNCVVWTPAYGYQTTYAAVGTGATKASLGWVNFGLSRTTRIVLGNQATGENYTLMGTPVANDSQDIEDANAALAYTYQRNNYDEDNNLTGYSNITKAFKVDTGIDYFGHKVQVYFNGKDGQPFQTYAIYDKATEKIVYSEDGDIQEGTLGKLAADNGFPVNKQYGAYISDRYDQITGRSITAKEFTSFEDEVGSFPWSTATDTEISEDTNANTLGNAPTGKPYGTDASTDTTSPDKDNGKEAGTYYKLINNGNGLDLVITLAPELAVITEQNTTAGTKTLRLSGDADKWMPAGGVKPSTFGVNDDGIIRVNSLTATSDKTLGDLVVAWEIKGTNYSVDYNGKLIKDKNDQYFYQLDKCDWTITGVVETYNAQTGTVTLKDGKTLKFTTLPIVNNAVPGPNDKDSELYFYNGVEYTFYLDITDASGKTYVKAEQGHGYKFLYTTYGDFDMGALGSGDLGYYAMGVDWDGNIVTPQQFTTIDGVKAAGDNYEALTIAKKNLGSANNTTGRPGNEIMAGYYTGYAYDASSKDLNTADAGRPVDNWINTDGYQDGWFWDGKIVSDQSGDNTSGEWDVNKANVADGWAAESITNRIGSHLLTEDTKFILVSGTGTSTLKVDIRNGISGLLGAYDSVNIDVKRFDNDGIQMADYNAYFQVFDETYNNIYTNNSALDYSDDNYIVKTVILPLEIVTWTSSNNLYFTNKLKETDTILAGYHGEATDVRQFELWQNGVKGYYFIDLTKSTSVFEYNKPVTDDNKIGMFYALSKVDESNGTPIYKAIQMTDPELSNVWDSNNSRTICNVDLKYDYTAVNNVNTARLTQLSNYDQAGMINYLGNPGDQDVYNVTGAVVADLTGTGLASVGDLNNAVSIGYDITVAVVNNGHTVTHIYVTNVDASGVTTK